MRRNLYDEMNKLLNKGSFETLKPYTRELVEYLFGHLCYKPNVIRVFSKGSVEFEYINSLHDSLVVEISDQFTCWYMDGHENHCTNRFSVPREKVYMVINSVKMFNGGGIENPVMFSGAFNPPTIAHYNMIDSATKDNFDYVIFALSNQKFLDKKQKNRDGVAYSENERIDMVVEMTWESPKVLIYGIEHGYTYEVLWSVRKDFKTNYLTFAMGSDKLKEIEQWGHAKELLDEFGFYVMVRDDDINYVESECKRIFKNTEFKIAPANPLYDHISATMVRDKIKKEEDYKGLLHHRVFDYLQKRKRPV